MVSYTLTFLIYSGLAVRYTRPDKFMCWIQVSEGQGNTKI